MVLDTEYYSEEPVSIGGADENGEDDHGDGAGGGGSTGPGGSYTPPAPPPEAIAPGGKPLSARLYDELAMQRRDVLAATLLSHPALALDYALFVMIDDRASTFSAYGSTLRDRSPQDPVSGEQPATRERGYLAEAHDGPDASWLAHKSEVDRVAACRALDADSKTARLAYTLPPSLDEIGMTSRRERECQD